MPSLAAGRAPFAGAVDRLSGKKDGSEDVLYHAKETLNFHLSTLLYTVACVATCVGAPLVIGVAVFTLIFMIVATIKAADGIRYRYPLTIRLVK